MEVLSDSPECTMDCAAALAARLQPGTVIYLEGDLGAGKTCFSKGLARGLGLDPDDVSSPTFAFVHVHPPASPQQVGFVHVDLYRLSDLAELTELGLDELPDARSIAAVEWPERLGTDTPANVVRVHLSDLGDERRKILIEEPARGTPPAGCIARSFPCS